MARFISVVVEYPDPKDEDGTKPLKQKTYFVSPMKVGYLKEFKDVFERVGTQVIYMDAGQTIEHSKEQARDFYKQKLK